MNISHPTKYNCVQKSLAILLLLLLQNGVVVIALPPAKIAKRSAVILIAELSNKDIVDMIATGLSVEIIIAKIKTSKSKFDTSPADIVALKKSGVPDSVILAMVLAPQETKSMVAAEKISLLPLAEDTSRSSPASSLRAGEIRIPDNTPIEVELTYTVASDEVQEGSTMSFKTIRPVKVKGVTVIEGGASAVARVRKASGGGSWGKAGKLEWAMQGTTAIDGSNVPLQFDRKTKGDGKGGQVAAAILVTSLISLPFAFLWAFKKGKSAKVPAGTRFEVFTYGEVIIQTSKSAAEIGSLNTGNVDLNGTWVYGDNLVRINQRGAEITINYSVGKAACGGGAVPYVFQGSIEGSQVVGRMPVCTQPEFVERCYQERVTELSFTADFSYAKISGKTLVPHKSILSMDKGVCSFFQDRRQDREVPFSLTRVGQ